MYTENSKINIMEKDDLLSKNQIKIEEITGKICGLKDRIVLEPDSEIKEMLISVLMELEEFRKMLLSLNDDLKTRDDVDKYLGEMESYIYSGTLSFSEAFKKAGGLFNPGNLSDQDANFRTGF
jgi:hypothetical protein